MAVSEVQIAKLALQHLGDRYDITSLDESGTEAEQVNLVFANLRDALIREHPWKFALRYYTPGALTGTPPARWGYMYTYPSDALKVWRIVNPLDPHKNELPPLKWTIARNADDTKVLLTDEAEPEFEYSKLVTDSAEFDANFDMALSYRIAEAIAMPITGDLSIKQSMGQEARVYVGTAKMEDGNEGVNREISHDPDWIRARG
jgi:hypothetical protein